jgi:hypothetical protein
MAMVFPTSPTVGQVFTSGSRSWVWNGSAWDSPSAINVLQVPYGLEFIRTVDFSGAASHSFGSDAEPIFTNRYDNYKIIVSNNLSAANEIELSFRVRANTTDLTSGTYQNQVFLANSTTLTGIRSGAVTQARVGVTSPSGPATTIIELQNPALPRNTVYMATSFSVVPGGGPIYATSYGWVFNTSLYNGFTLRGTENISGTMSVYGYKK